MSNSKHPQGPVTAANILRAGLGHMVDRAVTYDAQATGERSMAKTVELFNLWSGHNLTEEEGWFFQIFLKSVRSNQGAHRTDNYEDGAAYFGLAGEASAKARRPAPVRGYIPEPAQSPVEAPGDE